MSESNQTVKPVSAQSNPAKVVLRYDTVSRVQTQADMTQMQLATDNSGEAVDVCANINKPLLLRDGMLSLFAVVSSDFRYVPRDRAAYQAYLQLKKATATQTIWQAQQAYFEWLHHNDPLAYWVLDPVVTAHPDQLFFEVFSKDEAAYAKFSFHRDSYTLQGEPSFGTTNIDYSERLVQGISQIRSWNATTLAIGKTHVSVRSGESQHVEKAIQVPDNWVRGFLQVQTVAAQPCDNFQLAPIDLYNLLRHLRLHADIKGKRRGIRIELEPGKFPRLVLEPWEKVIQSSAAPYRGKQAKVVRVWGRRRLLLLQGMLPYATAIHVYLRGNGLPSFWVLADAHMSFTLGLTGFTSSNWSQALNLDLLVPHVVDSMESMRPVHDFLKQHYRADLASMASALTMPLEKVYAVLQASSQRGQVCFDIAAKTYRWRSLTHMTLESEQLNFRNKHHRHAHDLVQAKAAATITAEQYIYNTGVELTGQVDDATDQRQYQPQLLINEEGGVSKAQCTCPFYRKHKLTQGPCAHLIALRLCYANELREREKDPGRHIVLTQTKTLSRRDAGNHEHVYIVLLDRNRIQVRWGISGETMRLQQLCYNSDGAARTAFETKIDDLTIKGYLDISAG